MNNGSAQLPVSTSGFGNSLLTSTSISEDGRYDLMCQVGDGGAGIVYKAWDRVLNKFVALKLLQVERLECDHLLRDEVAIAQSLTHPGIVRIHDLVHLQGVSAISMEYVEGCSLSELLKLEGCLSAGEVRRLGHELCQAIGYAHKAGVIHCDIKPANILLDKGAARITDFGVAIKAGHTKHASPGTLAYMSPEQRGERSGLDCRTDIYAVGIVLFEALIGRRPSDEELQSTKHLTAALRAIPDKKLIYIVGRCLEYHRDDRFPDADAIIRELQKRNGRLPDGLSIVSRTNLTRLIALLVLCTLATWSLCHFTVQGARPTTHVVGLLPIECDAQTKEDAEILYEFLARRMTPGPETYVWKLPVGQTAMLPRDSERQLDIQIRISLARTGEGFSSSIDIRSRLDRAGSRVVVKATSMTALQHRLLSIMEGQLTPFMVTSKLGYHLHDLSPTNYSSFKQANHVIQWVLADDETLRRSIGQLSAILKTDPGCSDCIIRRAQAKYMLSARTLDASLRNDARLDTRLALKQDASLANLLDVVKLYAQYDNRDEAMAMLQGPAFAHVRGTLEVKAALGKLLFQDAIFTDAISCLKQVVAGNPWDVKSLNLLGTAQLALSHYDEAAESFRDILKVDNKNVAGWNNLAVSYMYGNRFEDAVAPLERVVAITPTAESYENLGMTLMYLGRGRVALPFFEKAVQLQPKEEKFAGDLAHAYRWLHMKSEATDQYRAAVVLAERETEMHPTAAGVSDLGLYYAALDDPKGFSKQFELARDLDEHSLDIDYKEAIGFALLGDDDRARANLDRLFRLGYPMGLAKGDPDLAKLQWSAPETNERLRSKAIERSVESDR